MRDTAAVIRQAFKDISADELEALCLVAQERTYPGGHVLIHEGEIEHVFYIVADGQVAITQKMAPVGERLLALRTTGEFFGEMALIESKPRSASVRAVA